NDVWIKTVAEIEAKEKMKEEGRKVAELGGLHIIGTERHDSRRIDNQLRGRAGRQGDPGSSRFYLSLQDDLMRLFAGEWVASVLTRLGMKEGEAIESRMVTRRIEKAQKKVEEWHFEQRKNLLEYDEVMDYQRKSVYGKRQQILDGRNPRAEILTMLRLQIDKAIQRFLDPDYGPASFASFASNRLGVEFQASEFRSGFDDAVKYAQDKAVSTIPTIIQEMLEENLNPDEDPKDWKWGELCRSLQVRFGLSFTDRELKKIPRERLDEFLIAKAEEKVLSIDLQDGQRYLNRSYGVESLTEWMRQKFDVRLSPEPLLEMEPEELKQFLFRKIREAYRHKDIEFPVVTAMRHYLPEKVSGGPPPDREKLYQWAVQRLGTALVVQRNPQALTDPNGFFHAAYQILEEYGLTEEFVRTESRSRIREKLLALSAQAMPQADIEEIEARVEEVFSGTKAADAEDAQELASWVQQELRLDLKPEQFVGRHRDEAVDIILNAYDKKYRPEMRSVERGLILEQLDNAWKSHLLVMDGLR
ncbi:MAG: preprotein translocase subunit SecA, partial [Gemmataceae bacterium]|nr:preprotein translocase subunit SecA [Gemmataceae bacterium]